jgi:hypothetical protein
MGGLDSLRVSSGYDYGLLKTKSIGVTWVWVAARKQAPFRYQGEIPNLVHSCPRRPLPCFHLCDLYSDVYCLIAFRILRGSVTVVLPMMVRLFLCINLTFAAPASRLFYHTSLHSVHSYSYLQSCWSPNPPLTSTLPQQDY